MAPIRPQLLVSHANHSATGTSLYVFYVCMYVCVYVYMYVCILYFEYILYVCRVLTVIHTYSSDALAQGILKSCFDCNTHIFK